MKFQEFMERSELMRLHLKYQKTITPLIQDLKTTNLSFNESLIILSLFFEPSKPVSPSQLSKTLLLGRDRISQALRLLEKKNLIRRTIAAKDQREREISLNAKGKKKATDLIRKFERTEKAIESL